MKKTKALAALLLAVMMAFGLGCALADGYGTAVIDAGNSDRLHLRAQPSFEAQSLGLYFTGTQVVCRSDPAEDWVKVSIGANTGYMYSAYLRTGEAAGKVILAQPTGVVAAKDGANLRHGPSTGDGIVTTIRCGETMTILGETSGHWYLAEYRGSQGYVKAELVQLQSIRANMPAAFASVLLGERAFTQAFSGVNMMVDELDACFALENAHAIPARFTVLEMDNDGDMEAVVCASVGGEDVGYLVLDVQGEQIYGYPFFLRSMLNLKQDGTFSFSSGAMDNGIGRLAFRGPVAQTQELARCRDGGVGTPVYFVNGEPASQVEYDGFTRLQDAKPDVVWHAFTKEQIKARFAQ